MYEVAEWVARATVFSEPFLIRSLNHRWVAHVCM